MWYGLRTALILEEEQVDKTWGWGSDKNKIYELIYELHVTHFIKFHLISPEEHFMKLFVRELHQQLLKTNETLPSDRLRANFSVKITGKMLRETLP